MVVLSVVQARFTELFNDEAYYWLYSAKLCWGYFDHPPMIALLIRCGYFIFHNELGVRLFPMIMGITTIYLVEKLLKPQNLKLFYAVIASMAVLQIGCMMAVPDVPLLFFSVLFFYAYKNYIETNDLKNAVVLGICMSLLIYSKYQGVLLILFTILSNILLLRKRNTWIALIVFVLILFPHLWWQWQYNLPSLKYHWIERFKGDYRIVDTLSYLGTQPFILGPFMGLLFLYALTVFKPDNAFERALKVNVVGVYIFFFIMSFKGAVQGNWTLVIAFPMLYMGYKQAILQPRLGKLIVNLFPFTVVLLMGLRVFMVYDFLPAKWGIDTEFHNNKLWAQQIEKVAGNTPVAFMNSYQMASKYQFYSGNESFSLNNVMGRKNQYTIWDKEYEFQGKKVMVVANYYIERCKWLATCKDSCMYAFTDNFRSYGNVKIIPDNCHLQLKKGDSARVRVRLCYLNNNIRDFEANPDLVPMLTCVVLKGANVHVAECNLQRVTNSMVDCHSEFEVWVKAPDTPGKYGVSICIKSGWLPPAINENHIDLEVISGQ